MPLSFTAPRGSGQAASAVESNASAEATAALAECDVGELLTRFYANQAC